MDSIGFQLGFKEINIINSICINKNESTKRFYPHNFCTMITKDCTKQDNFCYLIYKKKYGGAKFAGSVSLIVNKSTKLRHPSVVSKKMLKIAYA